MKQYYSTIELAGFCLNSLPKARESIMRKAKRENWPYKEVPGKGGKGGVRREFLVPENVFNEIKEKTTQKLIDKTSSELLPAIPVETKETNLTARQAIVEGARKGVIKAVEELMLLANIEKQTAIKNLLINAKLPENAALFAMIRNASDTRGGGADRLPSARTIQRWFDRRERNDLAPRIRQVDYSVPEWATTFLALWQTPQKPSISAAYRKLETQYEGELPSEHQVRRFIDKLGNVSKHKGRMLPRELKNISVFTRRTYDTLWPADIFTADGHTFDAEMPHPFHGRPFRPELTTVADVGTRKLVGFSIDLAESALSVLAAVSNAVKTNGIPSVFYVDNGSGYKNALMSDVSTGILGRLGTVMVNSLPYNSQARGVIERLHKTVWVEAAKEWSTYIGADMDPQAKQLVFKQTRKEVKEKGSLVGSKFVPTFERFVQFCNEKIEEYNNRPHRSLPIYTDISGKKRHLTPNEMWQLKIEEGVEILNVSEEDANYLFMPQVQRTIRRGEIEFLTNRYFSRELEEFNGEVMNIGYDIHDGSKVWVYDDLGRLVCEAEFNGNAVDYMPQSFIQAARDKRAVGREKRAMVKVEEARLERKGSMLIEHQNSVNIAGSEIMMNDLLKAGLKSVERVNATLNNVKKHDVIEHELSVAKDEFVVPTGMAEKYEQYLISSKKPISELTAKEARWLESYPKTSQFRVFNNKASNE